MLSFDSFSKKIEKSLVYVIQVLKWKKKTKYTKYSFKNVMLICIRVVFVLFIYIKLKFKIKKTLKKELFREFKVLSYFSNDKYLKQENI